MGGIMRVRKLVYRKVHVKTDETQTLELSGLGNIKKNTCDYCGNKITDKTFLMVVCEKSPNYLFHRCCYPKATFDTKIMEDGDPECAKCGHPYHRHYDLYEDEHDPNSCFYAGCKYCNCPTWKPQKKWKYPKS